MSDLNNNARNMKSLKEHEKVRLRAGVIFGNNDVYGAFHTFEEVLANSIDEAREGFGDYIKVVVRNATDEEIKYGADPTTYVLEVHDDGRGLPMDWNEDEGKYNWELALCTLYASGKYEDDQYSQALGLNGLGLTATQFASTFLNVWSTYDNKTRYMHFEKGHPIGDMKVTKPIREGTGTSIVFQPDSEVFPALRLSNFDASMFITNLNNLAMLHDGLAIEFNHAELENTTTFCYKNGIAEFIDAITADQKVLCATSSFSGSATGVDETTPHLPDYTVDMRIAFNFARDCSSVKVFHNGSCLTDGGTSVDGFQRAITSAFTNYARVNGKIAKTDRFLYRDIESILVCIVSTDAPGNRTWFGHQTKTSINNPFIGKALQNFVSEKLNYWLENTKGGVPERVITEVVNNKKAREEGEEVSKKILKNLSKTVKLGSKPKGFKDCSSKDVDVRELYIVEGKSALGSVKLACDPKFQAVIPVRGKIINCLKEKITRVLNNDIIIDLYRVFGCGLEVKGKNLEGIPEFDITKLNWSKIIICTDADVDGNHIRCLLLTMFYVLSPSLIKHGKIYVAETPLYEITYKNDIRFAFDDKEKAQILEEFKAMGAKEGQIDIQRSKGLGENDPEMMSISTMRPDTRRLIPIEYPADDTNLAEYLNAILGDDLETRRVLIEEYFKVTESDVY